MSALILLIIMAVPITAIISSTQLKMARLRSKRKDLEPLADSTLRELLSELKQLRTDNSKMVQRLENLETIVTSTPWDEGKALPHHAKDPTPEEQAQTLAQRLSQGS